MNWREAVPNLPPGWVWSTLREVASTQLGKMLSKKSKTGVDEQPYLRNQNVQWARFNLTDLATMSFEPAERTKFELRPRDLIVCEGGEVGRAAVWRGSPVGCFYQKALHRVRPFDGIVPEYLMYALWCMSEFKYLDSFTSGSTIRHLPQEDLRILPVPLAPSAEQRRIVDELERRLAHLNAARKGLVWVTEHLELARKAVLIGAVPTPWPDGWKHRTVADVGDARLGLQRSPSRHTGANPKPYLRVANVFEDRFDLSDVMTMHFTAEEEERYRLAEGDILLNEGQSPELLGRPAMWQDGTTEMYFTNSLIRFRAGPDVLPSWALLVFRRHLHSGRFRQESRVTTNIAHLALGRFKTVEFPVPPLDEQAALVADVERRLSLLDAASRTVLASRRKADQVRRALLQDAFNGRLVHQDPSEEPADTLLGRIRATSADVPQRRQGLNRTTRRKRESK